MTTMGPRLVPADDQSPAEDARERVALLFREHYAGLCGFVLRYVKSRGIAEEVVQEVFLRVWERCEAATREVPTRAYLYAAARNQAITILRHERVVARHVASQASPATPPAVHPAADAEVELDEISRAARQAIAALPERSRLVFLLSRERGMSYAEIATVLGISIKTVEGTMMRALKRLRASLEGIGTVALIVQAALRLLQ